MSKDKQIEEMAKVMNECCNIYDEQGRHIRNKCYECEEWSDDNHCCCSYNKKEAEALYNAGYRKASEVASEIFVDIEKIIDKHYNKHIFVSNDLGDEEIDAVINFSDDVTYDIAELKKKYTEGGE